MLKLKKREIIKTLVLGVVLLLVLFIFDWPIYSRISSTYKSLKEEKSFYLSQLDPGISYDQALAQYNDLNDRISYLDQVLLPSGEELQLITSLEKEAAKFNLKQTIDLVSSKNNFASGIGSVTLNVKLTGSFESLVEYLSQLSLLRPQVGVSGVNVINGTGDNIEANLLIDNYLVEEENKDENEED